MATPDIPQAPDWELTRTPIGERVAAHAHASGLFLYHFEHRVHLPLPEHWLPEDQRDARPTLAWRHGVLPFSKYEHFRLDAMVGTFHPAHPSQWTVHELCHRLVGFAYKPGGTPLFHALGARLAELLPTALWHFFEEAHLNRCPAHAGQGSLFAHACGACEAHGRLPGPLPGEDAAADEARERGYSAGRRFFDRELSAIARSRKSGRMEPNGYASLDLATDALNYTATHLDRLHSPEMAEFVRRFSGPELGCHSQLDALEARVLEVRDALLDGRALVPWHAPRWASQDAAWRLLLIRAQCDPEDAVTAELGHLLDDLEAGGPLAACFTGYEALYSDFDLPLPEDVFALGYDLAGIPGRSIRQVTQGLESTLPNAMVILDAAETAEVVGAFLDGDAAERVPLARRFAAYLSRERPGPVADLALYEAAIAHPLPPDVEAATLGVSGGRDRRRRRSTAFEVLRFGCDVVALAQALEAEPGSQEPGTEEPASDIVKRSTCLLIGRPAQGELIITDVTAETANALERMGSDAVEPASVGLSRGEAAALEAVGVLVPAAWKAE